MDDDERELIRPQPLTERRERCEACGRYVNQMTGLCGCNDR